MNDKALNDALAGVQLAILKLHTAFVKQFSCKWDIEALEKLVAMQGELIEEQSGKLKTRDATVRQLKERIYQARSFISQAANHTEDSHAAHFVDMAEQWLSKGFAPVMVADFEAESQEQNVKATEKEAAALRAALKACQPTVEQAAASLRCFFKAASREFKAAPAMAVC